MLAYTLHWANQSAANQDWIISNVDNFLLAPKHNQLTNIFPCDDRNYIIAVSADETYASANLRYAADIQTWSLNSHTPNQWQIITRNRNITINCFLCSENHHHRLHEQDSSEFCHS